MTEQGHAGRGVARANRGDRPRAARASGWLLALGVLPRLALTAPDSEPATLGQPAVQADFKAFVQDVTENYAYVDRADKPWLTWPARYAEALQVCRTRAELVRIVESALDELHDFHAEVRNGGDDHRWLAVPTFADLWAEPNGHEALVIAVRRGSDAARAGIAVGDRITRVDGAPIDEALALRLGATPGVDPHARQWALLSLLAGRADAARHLSVRGPDGRVREIELPVERTFERPAGPVAVQRLDGPIGWIRFNNSLGEIETVEAFDRALQAVAHTRGLILDLRDVPSGGNSSVALAVMGRFVTRPLPYQHHRIPNYGRPDIERNWLELVTPRGPFVYRRPLVVLVDHWTGSMGEGMAIGFDAMHRARVIGTSMAGLAGAVDDFKLPNSGIEFAIATEQLFHVNGTPRHQWLPPIIVPSVTAAGDPILTRAIGLLRAATARKRG